MNRRRFLRSGLGAIAARPASLVIGALGADMAWATPRAQPAYQRLLILVELKGGNDGFNTVVPYTDPAYYALRPKLAIPRDHVVQVTDRVGFHPALQSLQPLFDRGRLAVLLGVGYPAPNLSHFRSIEIWDTASSSDRYLADGWLARTFAQAATPSRFAADGVVIGSNDMGPLAGSGARALALANTDQFLQRAKLARSEPSTGNPALAHILKVESDVVRAATHLDTSRTLATDFPGTPFGNVVRTACHVAASLVPPCGALGGSRRANAGWVMSQVDIAGSVAAWDRAQGPIVTVAVNSFVFKEPVFVGDLVSFYARVLKVGRTSITVDVVVYAQRGRQGRHTAVKVTEAQLTYVAVNEKREPRVVPGVIQEA